MTEELKPCPFCGEEARVEKLNLGKQGLFRVICPNCLTATHLREEKNNAVAEWNARPIEDAQTAENKRLREALELIAEAKFYFARDEEKEQIRRVCEIAEEALKVGSE